PAAEVGGFRSICLISVVLSSDAFAHESCLRCSVGRSAANGASDGEGRRPCPRFMDQIAALAGESYSFGADQFHTDDAVRRQCCGFVQISCIMPRNPRSGIRRRIDVTQDLWWTRLGPLEPTDQVANAGGCASKCRMTFRPKDQ